MGFSWKVPERCSLQNQNSTGYFHSKRLLGTNAVHLNFNICCCFWVSQLCSSWSTCIWPASPNDAQHKVVSPSRIDLGAPVLQQQDKKIAMKLNKVLKVKISLLRSRKIFYLKKLWLISVNNEAAARQPKRYVPPGNGTELKPSKRDYNILINHWTSSFSLTVSTEVSVIPKHSIIK